MTITLRNADFLQQSDLIDNMSCTEGALIEVTIAPLGCAA